MEGCGRAALAGQSKRAGGAGDVDLLEGASDLLHRKRGAGVRHVDNQLDILVVVPTTRDRGGDVRFVLMVAADRLDWLAQYRAASSSMAILAAASEPGPLWSEKLQPAIDHIARDVEKITARPI